MPQLIETVKELLLDYTFIKRDLNSKNDFITIICPTHGQYHKTVNDILNNKMSCPKCSFLSPSRMMGILIKARSELSSISDIDDEKALYYRLLIEHKQSGILFQKIGITESIDGFEEFWNPWKWKDFNIEIIDKIECSLPEAEMIQRQFQTTNSEKKISIPNYMKFNLNKTYEYDEIWQAKSKAIKDLREIYLLKQKQKCTICGLPVENPTLDHMHQKKVRGTGFIRAVCCSQCNTFIARSENNASRHGISQNRLPDVLRNMALHLENQTKIIHPTEIPKKEKVGTREWNKVRKYYFKVYPKKKVPPKKPIYVTESWLKLKADTEEYLKEVEKNKKPRRQRTKL